jgi:competence protein ComEA
MHRQSQDEVAAAARRRLELLGRELEQAGLRRVDDEDDRDEQGGLEATDAPGLRVPAPVAPAGRHARAARPGPGHLLLEWLRRQLPDTVRGRTELGSGPALLVVGLVALALAGTVVVVIRMHGDSEPVPARTATVTAGTPSTVPLPRPSASGSVTAPGATPGAAGASVTVDVSGKVRHPGVATLPAGSRVIDALRKAGGARARVDLGSLNLARVLVDGEQILVGRGQPGGGVAAGASSAAPDPDGPLVNLNTATETELETLPGVGPVTAQKILEWRTANGAFSSVDELLEVDGIGDKTLAELAPHVTL